VLSLDRGRLVQISQELDLNSEREPHGARQAQAITARHAEGLITGPLPLGITPLDAPG
jgi:hypothetical protein